MTAGLLATGDEIIHGDTLNTNSHQLAKILSSEGISLGLHLACSDKENELVDCINFLASSHDLLIMTGGLGPTSDDRTRFALSRCLGVELIEYPAAIDHIKDRLKLSNDQLNAGNRQQALFPAGATILPNPNGTAVGCYYARQNKVFILLPGPPRECLPMFNNYVLPLLHKQAHSEKQLLKWRIFGVAESELGQQIDEALAGIDCKIGYRLETPYVECKVSCKTPLVETVKQIIEPLIAPHIIASPDQKASERLYDLITKTQIPISIIDEVTGGILQTLIQQPISYPWIKFYPYEQAELHFHLRGLKEFWSGEGKTGKTQLSIDYKSNRLSGKESHESHELPFRSPLVVHYAAEWLSYRLFHLINQLHQ